MKINQNSYTPQEELINGLSHAFGILLGIVATFHLLILDFNHGKEIRYYMAHTIYGLSMILLYSSSTCYHLLTEPKAKRFFKYLDHASIYLFIAGSYTPFLLLSLGGERGTQFALIIWIVALVGIAYEIFFLGRFRLLSVIFYLILGWFALLFFQDFTKHLAPEIIRLILIGGILYAAGTPFYIIKKIPYHHAIWHIFVLAGSLFIYLATAFSFL